MKPGLFEAAHTGTLFLDEIGELDSRMQAKLLRVLDGQSYFRLGGSRKVLADVRIVAATNLSLDEAVQSGKFRRGSVPSPGCISPACAASAGAHGRYRAAGDVVSARHRRSTLSDEALAMLEDYSWPGNIRELRIV